MRPIAITTPKAALTRQSQEIAAQAEGGVVERLGRAVQVVRSDKPDRSIAQIASLKQNENDEDDDDASGRQRRQKRGHDAVQNLGRVPARAHALPP